MPTVRPVLLCDLEGKIIKEYETCSALAMDFGHIQSYVHKFLTGEATRFHKRYLLCYKNQYSTALELRQKKFRKSMIVILNRNTGMPMAYCNTTEDAAIYTGASDSTIIRKSLYSGAIYEYIIVKYEDYNPDFNYTGMTKYQRTRRPVVEIGTDNEIIKRWETAAEAARDCFVTKERMKQVLNKKTYVTAARIFVYHDEYDVEFDYDKYRYILPNGKIRRGCKLIGIK